MWRLLIISLLGLTVAATANAQWLRPQPHVDAIEIVAYGIYDVNRGEKVASATQPLGYLGYVSDHKLVERTTTICARLGLHFGFEFKVNGAPMGTAVTLDWVTRYPPEGMTNTQGKHFKQGTHSAPEFIGNNSFRTFSFDEAWEMVPGEWSLEFYYKGRKVGEQKFTVMRSCPIS